MEKNLTQGSVKKLCFKYLGAAFGGSMISCIYGLVDVAVVGQYQGPQGTAALSIVAPIWTILYSLGILTGSGGSIFGDLYFVFGLNMGIFGAGLATAIGVTLTIAVMVSHFFSRKMRSGYPGFMVIFIRQKSWCSTAVPSLFQKSRWE